MPTPAATQSAPPSPQRSTSRRRDPNRPTGRARRKSAPTLPRTVRRLRAIKAAAHRRREARRTNPDGPPAPDGLLHLDAGQERPEFDRAVFKSIHDAGGSPWSSVRDWGAAVPSRHRRDSFPSDEVVGGFFFDFEVIRTASRDAALDASTRRSSRRCKSRPMWIRR